MTSLRPSLRTVTLSVMVIAVAVTAVLAYVLFRAANNRADTNARVNLQVAQISRYEDARFAYASLGSNLTTYYVLRDSTYIDGFELARAQVTQSLDAAREAAPALGDAEVVRADALVAEYAPVSEAQERVLRAAEQDDIAGAFVIVGETSLIEVSQKLTQNIQQAIDDDRNGLAIAQRDDTAEQKQSVAFSLGIAGTWAAFILLLGLASFRWVVRPMERVSLSTLTIAAGDLTARVPESGPRELAQVGADVNRMTEALIRRSEELNAYLSRNLEARTGELEGANSALTASEARFRSLAEHSPVGIYQLSPERRILYLNPAALAILETDELTIAQQVPFERFFTAESLETMRGEHAKRARGIASSYEVEVVGLRGTRRNLLVSGAPVADGNGGLHSLVGTMMDITERKRAEDALRVNEEKFRLLFASNPHPMWVYDLESLAFLEVNGAAVANYGYTRAEFLHMRITDIRPEEENVRLLATLKRTSPLMQSGEWRHRTNDGRIIDVEITSHSFRFESHEAVLVVALDITEQRRVARALAESEGRFRSLVQNASDLITVIRADTTVIYQSPSVQGILGYEAPQLIGRRLSEIVHADDADRLLAFLSQATTTPTTAATFEARLRHHDGTWRTFEIVGSDHTADPAIGGFVLNTRDVSERKVLEHQLRDQAFKDALTGLANRARFMDRLEHALERSVRGAKAVAVLFIDLDNFKSVNDSLGHAAGDSVLMQAGQRVQNCLRAGDTVARLGGDEFAALIEDMRRTGEAVRLASRIVEELGKPFELAGGNQIIVGASVGLAFANEKEPNRDLVHDADVAMYVAKTHGKSRYEVYNPRMHEAMAKRLELVADLQRALETPELFLEYQPIVRLATGKLTGVEALVRWQHPRRGRIMPADFIALAEESGLILSLGRWVLTTACRQARQWEVRHGDEFVSMSVNISVRQLQQATFVEEVAEVLGETGVDPSRIVLEVTESVMMQDLDATIPVLKSLKGLGVRLAIDDFGTGYSSLSYLARYPFDVLKIDKSFIDGIDAPGNQLELTRAIIELAKVLDLEVVAEGIEREAQASQLRNLNCDLVQGFLFSRPLPAQAIAEMIDRGRRDLAA